MATMMENQNNYERLDPPAPEHLSEDTLLEIGNIYAQTIFEDDLRTELNLPEVKKINIITNDLLIVLKGHHKIAYKSLKNYTPPDPSHRERYPAIIKECARRLPRRYRHDAELMYKLLLKQLIGGRTSYIGFSGPGLCAPKIINPMDPEKWKTPYC